MHRKGIWTAALSLLPLLNLLTQLMHAAMLHQLSSSMCMVLCGLLQHPGRGLLLTTGHLRAILLARTVQRG